MINATKGIDVETFTEAKQARADEVQLHRDLALELIDIGWKALATRLHPDRGGSHAAMRRLNRVRQRTQKRGRHTEVRPMSMMITPKTTGLAKSGSIARTIATRINRAFEARDREGGAPMPN